MVKPVPLDVAFVGLYYRTVVLVSTHTLDLLSPDEFAALVAHEVAHDYDWNAYWAALKAHDAGRLRELELRCDGIAVLTLVRLGIDPERLASAVKKQTDYNHVRDAAVLAVNGTVPQTTDRRYIPLEQRLAFIRAVARIPWRPAAAATDGRADP